jgi:hypothetical protein
MKIMRKIKIFIVLFVVLGFISCDDFLDVMPDNRTELDSKEKITQLLVSAYPIASSWMFTEYASDNADENRGRNYTTYQSYEEEAFNWQDISDIDQDTPYNFWEGCYHAIASSNQALEAIEELGNEDGSLDAQKGEALITRAYGHFLLVNVFCKHYSDITGDTDLGIPYSEAPEKTVNPQTSRGTVAEVYEKINRDIEEALPLISDNLYKLTPKYHFNKRAAYAFATRFNLYYRKYDQVIKYATLVLGSEPATVLRDWKALQATTILQTRSDLYVNAADRANLLLTSLASWWPYEHNMYSIGYKYTHNKMIADYETLGSDGPWGTYSTFYCKYSTLTPKTVLVKFLGYFKYSDPIAQVGQNYMIQTDFTTDETLLCRAEAYVMKDDLDNATKDLNTFMQAYSTASLSRASINNFYMKQAYYTPKNPTPKKRLNPDFTIKEGEQENFIHCVLHLRRILTIHEGLRWNDIKRYGIDVYRRTIEGEIITVSSNVLTKDDPRRAIQIPDAVIKAGLQPNPR